MAGNRRTTERSFATPEAIAAAAQCLRRGGLVAMPTETVYGLAADATSDEAVAGIYAAKGRPTFNPLIAHVGGVESAKEQARFDADAERLARAFWPGPLTLVLPAAATCRVSLLARAGLDSIALRAPDHPVARALIEAAGRPLAAPSANASGHVSPTDADHVLADLDGRIDWILDAGRCRHGLESTIVACLDGGPTLLRPGALPREAIEAALGRPLATRAAGAPDAPRAPGQLVSHYAPHARLRLAARAVSPEEAALDFNGALAGAPCRARLDLSPRGNLVEAAANLFAWLRALDQSGASIIATAPIPASGLGAAINDRLRRAAAPRDL
ncbi:translation factor SUA5 [Roseiarcus fermentans]|uniref:Threonylcarbamoyl-AMP synthase n=1 Tax=Roseiarcus fermentans TaxID=1473586 RepID=A0A366FUC1_9HYPH|nr:L-threonylcarbamoyladenylate synthase [Roseiarcus fermentans]RBP18274.1 translation factor SUA5 [Roseiarcus fermentans]